FAFRTESSVSELAASMSSAAPIAGPPGTATRPWTMPRRVIFTPTAPTSEKTRLASFPLIVVAAAPAPSISSFLLTTSWPEVSLIVPAGTMIVDPGGADAEVEVVRAGDVLVEEAPDPGQAAAALLVLLALLRRLHALAALADAGQDPRDRERGQRGARVAVADGGAARLLVLGGGGGPLLL